MANGIKTAVKPVVKLQKQGVSSKKLIILDTSVLLHDPESLFRFQEHDIFMPREVLAQIDHHKKGQTDVARNARQVTRTMDHLFRGDRNLMSKGASLAEASNGSATGKFFFQTDELTAKLPQDLLRDEGDRRIIAAAVALRDKKSRSEYSEVVLVTKDANMRYAALCFENGDIEAQDYLSDRVLLKDSDVLPTGYVELPANFWETHDVVWVKKDGPHNFWHAQGPICTQLAFNDCVYGKSKDGSDFFAKVSQMNDGGVTLKSLTRYDHNKNAVSGIVARNREQIIALDHLMDPEIDLVCLLGEAGTGKSLCAIAAGYEHIKQGKITSILATRAMVKVEGEDAGFLPGDMNDKFGPWMEALEDSKAVLLRNAGKTKDNKIEQNVQDKDLFEIKPIGFLRGRTFEDRFVIIDEAQNLTLRQVKLLATRPGNGAKLVFCGNLGQIDTPFLDEMSSGLTNLIMKMRGSRHVAHVILQECVRSRLAELAVERL